MVYRATNLAHGRTCKKRFGVAHKDPLLKDTRPNPNADRNKLVMPRSDAASAAIYRGSAEYNGAAPLDEHGVPKHA